MEHQQHPNIQVELPDLLRRRPNDDVPILQRSVVSDTSLDTYDDYAWNPQNASTSCRALYDNRSLYDCLTVWGLSCIVSAVLQWRWALNHTFIGCLVPTSLPLMFNARLPPRCRLSSVWLLVLAYQSVGMDGVEAALLTLTVVGPHALGLTASTRGSTLDLWMANGLLLLLHGMACCFVAMDSTMLKTTGTAWGLFWLHQSSLSASRWRWWLALLVGPVASTTLWLV